MHYYCRQCKNRLNSGQQMCSCGQLFDNPVPENDDQIGVIYWEPSHPSSTEAQVDRAVEKWNSINPATKAGGFGILAVVLIVLAIAGLRNNQANTANQDSLTVVNPRMARGGAYIRGRTNVVLPSNEEPMNQPRPLNLPENTVPNQSSDPIAVVQSPNDQFDAENETFMADVASRGGTDITTVKTIAHAILRGYVNDSTSQNASSHETDFQETRTGLNIILKYEMEKPGVGCWQVALMAANGTDANTVVQQLNSVRSLFVDFSDLSHMEDTSDLAQVINSILNSR